MPNLQQHNQINQNSNNQCKNSEVLFMDVKYYAENPLQFSFKQSIFEEKGHYLDDELLPVSNLVKRALCKIDL